MTDPKLEEEISLLTRCMETLRRFHDIFDKAVLTETVVPEDERKIQALREALPGEWDSLHRQLHLRNDDSVRIIVDMVTSLSAAVIMTHYRIRNLYALWHKSYMKLHFLFGKLQYRKEMLESIRSARLKGKKFLIRPVFVIIVAVVGLLLYIVLRQISAGR